MRLTKIKYKSQVLTALFAMCIIGMAFMTKNGASGVSVYTIGSLTIPKTSVNGICQNFIFLICVVMTCINYRSGAILSYLAIAFAIFDSIMGIIKTRTLASIPGFFSAAMALVTVMVVSRQFAILEKDSVTDFVTGLTNMRGFLEKLERRLKDKKSGYIFFIQLENFRMINDNCGHAKGDIILKSIGERIEAQVGKNGIVCKTGGAEYCVILNSNINIDDMAAKIVDAVTQKFEINQEGFDNIYYLETHSCAVAFPDDANDTTTLVKYADIALFHSAVMGNNAYLRFDKDMESEVFRKAELENMIKESLENDYFYMVYQPQYGINKPGEEGKLRGFEALLRLRMPNGTMVSPAEFIPVAETSDLILKIDEYVLKRTMTEFVDYINDPEKGLTLSVNVSAASMAGEDFAEKVMRFLSTTGFNPECLEIEITEYSFAESMETTVKNINSLKEIGVKIALDDFGTGYTSLSQLINLPIDLLKIDKSLVDDIENSQINRDFINAVIYMGHLMECEVISEGVENRKQLDLLREQECDFVQGYVLGKPLDYAVAVDMVK